LKSPSKRHPPSESSESSRSKDNVELKRKHLEDRNLADETPANEAKRPSLSPNTAQSTKMPSSSVSRPTILIKEEPVFDTIPQPKTQNVCLPLKNQTLQIAGASGSTPQGSSALRSISAQDIRLLDGHRVKLLAGQLVRLPSGQLIRAHSITAATPKGPTQARVVSMQGKPVAQAQTVEFIQLAGSNPDAKKPYSK
jgi:hypothetical protein